MLHLLKISLLSTVLAFNAATAATIPFFIGKTQINIESVKDGKTLLVDLKDIGNRPIKIVIKDSKGDILRSSSVKGDENITYRYDLAKLPEGAYQISFSTPTDEFIQTINICKNCVNLDSNQLIEKHKPSFRFNDNKLDINLLNKSQQEIIITIYDEEGNKIIEDISKSGISFGRRLDVSKLSEGTYNVAVKTEEETYFYDFKL